MDTCLHTPETIYARRHVPSWMILAGSAGAVNGFAFVMCEQFVTHLSGTFTDLGQKTWRMTLVFDSAAIILSFIAGAVASICMLHMRARSGDKPRWATPLVSVTLLLIGVAVAGRAGLFGDAADEKTGPPVLLLSMLAFAMGAQNAAVAATTGLAVRTTHVTGPATDLGIHLATAIFSRGRERWNALRGALLRGGKIMAFGLGAGLSVPLTATMGYLALLVPATGIAMATLLSFTLATNVQPTPVFWLPWSRTGRPRLATGDVCSLHSGDETTKGAA
jgi:uncharacterized membrane protein YoaK (UPF0700 family)